MKLKTLQVKFAHLSERIKTVGLLIRVGEATERSFRKMELLEFEDEEENNAAIDLDYDDNYDGTDLFCEEDDEKYYNLCSSCDENTFAHVVQACEHMICTNCVNLDEQSSQIHRGLFKLGKILEIRSLRLRKLRTKISKKNSPEHI